MRWYCIVCLGHRGHGAESDCFVGVKKKGLIDNLRDPSSHDTVHTHTRTHDLMCAGEQAKTKTFCRHRTIHKRTQKKADPARVYYSRARAL